jgi:F-type H+-transporting ATPase subunit epsilon
MPRPFRLQIVTPERVLMDGPVTSVIAPGSEGQFGVLAGHAPFVTELGIGELRYRDSDNVEHLLAVHGGFFQVSHDHATVLADAAERPDEIDIERARRAQERAREEQRRVVERFSEMEAARVRAALERSLNRLRVGERSR